MEPITICTRRTLHICHVCGRPAFHYNLCPWCQRAAITLWMLGYTPQQIAGRRTDLLPLIEHVRTYWGTRDDLKQFLKNATHLQPPRRKRPFKRNPMPKKPTAAPQLPAEMGGVLVAPSVSQETATPAESAPHEGISEPPSVSEARRNDTLIQNVGLDHIDANPWQPRKTFPEREMQDLADSIKEHGVLQFPVVRPAPDTLDRFQLVAGERRVRAAGMAGLKQIKVIVRHATNRQMAELAIVENRDRADVNAIEQAEAYACLIREFNVSVADVSKSAGKSRPVVSNALRLLDLPSEVQAMIATRDLSETHGRALARWNDFPRFVEFYAREIVRNRVPTKAVEKGFAYSAPGYEECAAAIQGGVYAETEWREQDAVAGWAAAHPEAFVAKVWEKRGQSEDAEAGFGWGTQGYICLDIDLLARLRAERDATRVAELAEESGRPVAEVASQQEAQREREKAERRKVLADNKKQRDLLARRSSAILEVMMKAGAGEKTEEAAVILLCALKVGGGQAEDIQTALDRRGLSLHAKSIFSGTDDEVLPRLMREVQRVGIEPFAILFCALEVSMLREIEAEAKHAGNWTPRSRTLLGALKVDETKFEPVSQRALQPGRPMLDVFSEQLQEEAK